MPPCNGRYGMGTGDATGLLLRQDLLDPRDRLVDRLLRADALGGDAVDGVRPDRLPLDDNVPPIAGGHSIVVGAGVGQELHRSDHAVRIARVEPEWLVEEFR